MLSVFPTSGNIGRTPVGIQKRPDETEEQFRFRYRKYHREWRRKNIARAGKPKPQVEEVHVVSIVVPERILRERDRAIQSGYRSEFAERLGEPLVRRSALGMMNA